MAILDAIRSFSGTEVWVIGDIILDIYLYGKVDRISPEAPIPILNHTNTRHALGGAFVSSLSAFQVKEILNRKEKIQAFETIKDHIE